MAISSMMSEWIAAGLVSDILPRMYSKIMGELLKRFEADAKPLARRLAEECVMEMAGPFRSPETMRSAVEVRLKINDEEWKRLIEDAKEREEVETH